MNSNKIFEINMSEREEEKEASRRGEGEKSEYEIIF